MKQLAIVLFAALAACVMPATSSSGFDTQYAQQAPATVVINGEVLTAAQRARLEELIGEAVPAGRYVLEANGMFGYEGQSERVDLAAYIRQRQASGQESSSGGTMMTDGRGSTMVGYGNCVSMTTPTGTFLGSGC